MIRSYILTAMRTLVRNRVISLINITGFAAGIAASILILLYVFSELSVDRFNENYDRIYRLEYGDFAVSGTAQALLLKEAIHEVEQSVRMDFRYRPLVRYGNDNFRLEDFFYADSTLFDVFTYDFIRGDPATALQLPFSLVLTESEAARIFGNEDPIGQMLKINNAYDYTVTAIIKDAGKSHIYFSAIGSFSTLPHIEDDDNHDRYLFNYMNFPTYVLFHENADPEVMAKRFEEFVDERYPESRGFRFRFRPLSDIYFNRDLNDSPPVRHGNLPLVYTLIAVAGFIMLIAIVNFINLATANASARSTETGVRKILGAGRKNLVLQFLTESLIMSIFAFLIAVGLVEILLPVFNNLLFTDLTFSLFYNPLFFLYVIIFVVLAGLLAGLYPAFYLSSMDTGSILKGKHKKGLGAVRFRRVLIVLQFTISIVLIIGTIMVFRQVEFMRHKDPGFEKQEVLLVRLNRDVYAAKDVFRDKLVNNNGVVSVSMSNNLLGYITWFNTWMIEGERKPHKFLPVDPEYIDLMGIGIIEGRNFEWDRIADQENTFIINEEAVRYFGFEDPAGKEFMVGGSEPVRIIGVVKDFHFRSLHEPIGPLVMGWQPGNLAFANIRIKGEDIAETINFVSELWEELSPGSPFEYMFLEDEIDKLYQSEIRISRLFRYFALLAIVIACMGLYGLSTFIAYQRTKEIGIRKVLGSGSGRIMFLLTWEFAKWVIVSNIIAWPVAYLIMTRWLDNFPYRIETGLHVFILAGLIALLIAILTVGGQVWRSANMNPSHTLRNE